MKEIELKKDKRKFIRVYCSEVELNALKPHRKVVWDNNCEKNHIMVIWDNSQSKKIQIKINGQDYLKNE